MRIAKLIITALSFLASSGMVQAQDLGAVSSSLPLMITSGYSSGIGKGGNLRSFGLDYSRPIGNGFTLQVGAHRYISKSGLSFTTTDRTEADLHLFYEGNSGLRSGGYAAVDDSALGPGRTFGGWSEFALGPVSLNVNAEFNTFSAGVATRLASLQIGRSLSERLRVIGIAGYG